MKIRIDESLCTGHGLCYLHAPDLIEADDRGYGKVYVEDVPDDLREDARNAERNCPERAVIIIE